MCILDTEASPEHLARGTARYADAMIAVVEPYYKSLETGRRMAVLAKDLGIERVVLVANKIRDDRDRAAVEEFARAHGLDVAGVIPFDDQMPEAERAGVALLARAGGGIALTAQGQEEGKRAFADEFADMTRQGHGECDDDCWCHDSPEEAARCLEERHGVRAG